MTNVMALVTEQICMKDDTCVCSQAGSLLQVTAAQAPQVVESSITNAVLAMIKNQGPDDAKRASSARDLAHTIIKYADHGSAWLPKAAMLDSAAQALAFHMQVCSGSLYRESFFLFLGSDSASHSSSSSLA